jgi:hypothetical protein
MEPNSQRVYARYPCRIPTRIHTRPSDEIFQGEIRDIGLGGAFVHTPGKLDSEVRLTFTFEAEEYILDAYVIRLDKGDPRRKNDMSWALEFHPYPDTLHHLSTLLDRIRLPDAG